ncbi:hypothetical protein BT63DRAFT_3081 [Microthyrium microscopicum]|uniref:Uncharacterized protein n=1 Tax=Microthyrium microscopicum TaxID=703497 RepID=A0A6A6UPF8_9PEZI|nr:hypothetical protein BT63DRAFT_3081 [Microthyrium microscopicum]
MNDNTSGHTSSNAGGSAGNAIKSGLTKIHGLGEAIRGNVNTFADDVTHTDDTKSRAVTDRGMNELDTGHYQGHGEFPGAGVTPADTASERARRDVQGEGGHVGTGDATYQQQNPLSGNSANLQGNVMGTRDANPRV